MAMTASQRENAWQICEEILDLAEMVKEAIDGWDELEDKDARDEATAEIEGWLADIASHGEDAQKLADKL